MIDLSTSELPNVSLVGGKGLNLIRLSRAGFNVPGGFVVESSYFNKLIDQLDNQLSAKLSFDNKNIKKLPSMFTGGIEEIIFEKNFVTEIISCYKKIGSQYVAVRSSAVNEDGEKASWAGQLTTELNVQQDGLEQAIKNCWASAYSRRALTYAFENGCALSDISIAVVVQEMVESDVSGVAFSVNPVTNNSQQIVIEAVYGLGEAIVSGAITPDEYIVDKDSLSIIESVVASQDKKLSLRANKTGWVEVSLDEKTQQKLSMAQIKEVAAAVKMIEKKMNYHTDVEWALKDGRLYITQSRPITTYDGAILT